MSGYGPITKLRPFYGGQFGVPGSEPPQGIRYSAAGNVLYVDANHGDRNDNNDGTDPMAPKATIQSAVSSPYLTAGSWIVVAPGTYTESVTIPITAASYCTLIGVSANHFWPSVVAAAAATDAITLSARGWTIKNLRVTGHSASAGIRLYEYADPGYQGAETLIDNVFFDGAWRALYGLEFEGAPGMVTVQNCRFSEHRTGANLSRAVVETATPRQNAYECLFQNNVFFENEGHVDGGFGVTLFQGNVFMQGSLIPAVISLDLRGGTVGENMVVGNVFGGDYSNAGGYYANAANPGAWVGNFAEDLAAAQVGDNGLTIAPPA